MRVATPVGRAGRLGRRVNREHQAASAQGHDRARLPLAVPFGVADLPPAPVVAQEQPPAGVAVGRDALAGLHDAGEDAVAHPGEQRRAVAPERTRPVARRLAGRDGLLDLGDGFSRPEEGAPEEHETHRNGIPPHDLTPGSLPNRRRTPTPCKRRHDGV